MVFKALLGKIKKGLARPGVFGDVAVLFRLRGRVDQSFLDQLESRLIQADVGVVATADIVAQVRQSFLDKEITGDVEAFVKQKLRDQLSGPSPGITFAATKPTVVLVAGVNGSGKTTSIAKLAKRLQNGRPKGHGRRLRHVPRRGRRAANYLERTHRLRHRQEPAGQRPGQRGPRRLRKGQRPRLRCC